MPLLVDTGFVYALADRKDAWHARTRAYLEKNRTSLLAPVTILPEVSYLLRERLGAVAEQAFVESIARGEVTVEEIKRGDWARIGQVMADYESLGLVDASIVAIAERLKSRVLATTDRRHFGSIRPTHIERFTLVP
jgi:predicted nucleic acid-binding protein